METKSHSYQKGSRRYAITMREPWALPEEPIELPPPGDMPMPPSPPNLLVALLAPIMMVAASFIQALIRHTNYDAVFIVAIMAIGFPLGTYINQVVQKKKYEEALETRKKNYQEKLTEARQHIQALAARQRALLEQEYPPAPALLQIAMARGRNPRLWWRRAYDPDFLALRVGNGARPLSFQVTASRYINQSDPLKDKAEELANSFRTLRDAPLLVDLKQAGSLEVSTRRPEDAYPIARRMLADLLTHHSPEDVRVVVLSDAADAAERWGWLKWTPHSMAVATESGERNLYFTEDQSLGFLKGIKTEFTTRLEKKKQVMQEKVVYQPAYIIIVDDTGKLRQLPDLSLLAGRGYEVSIHLIFIGSALTPAACRSRLSVTTQPAFRYVETWAAREQGVIEGSIETLGTAECEKMTRAMAGLIVSSGSAALALPDTVRISQILGEDPLEPQSVIHNWTRAYPNEELMLFPVGVHVEHDGISTLEMDFRPQEEAGIPIGGQSDYNAFLIGTTGSGKSIFLQSLVLAAAHRYSPKMLNFLFMDFKAGAAELQKLANLPHVVGAINDLGPELAERALQALEYELVRRKQYFEKMGNPVGIWELNNRYPDKALPHLLTVIDEFGKGIELFPDLAKKLFELGKQGRAFGMYFILANQEVVPAVDNLKSNVGWSIVLKVRRVEEMRLIDRNLPPPPGRGRGYIKSDKGMAPIQFQGAFSGARVSASSLNEVDEFSIFRFEADGSQKKIYAHKPITSAAVDPKAARTELDILVENMNAAAEALHLPSPEPIYLQPIPAELSLDSIWKQCEHLRSWDGTRWEEGNPSARLTAPLGYLDIPAQCKQMPLVVDFNQGDGNLWILGNPGSGKNKTLTTLLSALIRSHLPDEAQFYILEYGPGSLKAFEGFPHVGAVLRLNEQERLERLISLFNEEYQRRSEMDESERKKLPDIFIVINNYAELRATYEDQTVQFNRFVSGKALKFHMIVTTNRSTELLHNIADNISHRVVLYLSNRDEYFDVLGVRPAALSLRSEGRGYWVMDKSEGPLGECQAAGIGVEPAAALRKMATAMCEAWDGCKSQPINTLAQTITYGDLSRSFSTLKPTSTTLLAPLGFDYDNLAMLAPDMTQDTPQWLVLGPRHMGKTNFLLSLASALSEVNGPACKIHLLGMRRSPLLDGYKNPKGFDILRKEEDILAVLQPLLETNQGDEEIYTVLLIDDLPGAFEYGREKIAGALQQLAGRLTVMSNLYLVAGGTREELQAQFQHPLVKALKMCRTGLCFSKDNSDLEWFGLQLTSDMRRVNMPTGRAFFVSKGKAGLVQTVLAQATE